MITHRYLVLALLWPYIFLALDILLTNDKSELIQNLFSLALQDSGHSVIMSAPYDDESVSIRLKRLYFCWANF